MVPISIFYMRSSCDMKKQELQSGINNNWQGVFHIAVERFWPTLFYRIVFPFIYWCYCCLTGIGGVSPGIPPPNTTKDMQLVGLG